MQANLLQQVVQRLVWVDGVVRANLRLCARIVQRLHIFEHIDKLKQN